MTARRRDRDTKQKTGRKLRKNERKNKRKKGLFHNV